MTHADFSLVLPEFLLAVFALGALLAAVYTGKDGGVARPRALGDLCGLRRSGGDDRAEF